MPKRFLLFLGDAERDRERDLDRERLVEEDLPRLVVRPWLGSRLRLRRCFFFFFLRRRRLSSGAPSAAGGSLGESSITVTTIAW